MFSFQNQDSSDNEIKSSLCAYTGPCKGFQRCVKEDSFMSVSHTIASLSTKTRQEVVEILHQRHPDKHKETTNSDMETRPLLAKLLWADDGRTGVPLVSVSSSETAGHLISKGNKLDALFICYATCLWPTTVATILSAAWFFVPFFKRAWMAHLETPQSALKCLRETFLMQSNYLRSCYCARSCHSVWPCVWHQPFFHNIYAPD